ncbi:hypothetical protein AVEN_49622-1 [Araneus ventricosus]|uniref:Uncharacterized protein n=1 Tax=Araneus ventricosus TaxID=182803 RepID=A0A4Y2SCM0_ARAVE|nr:hypothetical protein AVEN_45467-1 [Araneus ventricosus]GBN85319.1 hypothetical protein AVEN_180687-1 [Araneus ventricosus]GBO15283.1 hypothetical protein AVEN_49622-1 [Araneus ventricosus]
MVKPSQSVTLNDLCNLRFFVKSIKFKIISGSPAPLFLYRPEYSFPFLSFQKFPELAGRLRLMAWILIVLFVAGKQANLPDTGLFQLRKTQKDGLGFF